MPTETSSLHLGKLQGPLLLFGGPYSNLQALEALKKCAEKIGVTSGQIICTGDIVAYCGNPKETVDRLRDWDVHVLMGNCEESFANDNSDCGCGFEEGSACDLLSAKWFNYANRQLGTSQRQWFQQLPRQITFNYNGIECLVVHGSVSSINRFMFASHPKSRFGEEIAQSTAKMIIGGHSGIPFTRKINGTLWHNPGVIGMPANDGSPRTWYSILTPNPQKARSLSIDIQPLEYDYAKAMAAMDSGELGTQYQQALANGRWPSLDILPEQERQSTGKALAFKKISYDFDLNQQSN